MKKLSILLPVYNEYGTIDEIIENVSRAPVGRLEKEIIVVDDASSDGTSDKLVELRKNYNFTFIRHKKNSGKGSAIITALGHASGDLILIQDADLEYDTRDYTLLLNTLSENISSVYGSRHLQIDNKRGYFIYNLGGKLITYFTNLLFNSHLTDVNTCYKLFRTDILRSLNLESKRFEFCEEVTAKLLKKGHKIKEIPIRYYPRKFSEGKKISWKDGVVGLWTIIKYRVK